MNNETKNDFTNVFQNAFSNKNKPNPEQVSPNNDKENPENVDDAKDNAIQNLIFYSFYPATCIVPLEDNLISINENVPELMKAKNHDPILQETIKTFHMLMKEKDDEILNLRRQINNENSTDHLVEMKSENIQTDLTLEECNAMERQINLLTTDIPEKNEIIHQLQQEIVRQKKSFDVIENDVQDSNPSKVEDDLEEAYKNLMELEEKNTLLQNQILEMTEKYKILQYQFDDINELKMEIEDAKIQAEEDLHKLEETLKFKDIQLKNNENKSESKSGNGDLNYAIELEKMKNAYERRISEMKKSYNDNKGNRFDIDDVIVELKEKIYNETPTSKLINLLPENFKNDISFQGGSDKQIISNLIQICCDDKTSENELKELVPILNSISYLENGNIDIETVTNKLSQTNTIYAKLNKEQLIHESLKYGLQVKIKEKLSKSDLKDLKKEYMKLENILNIMNKYFKLTQLGILNRMSRKDLLEGIIEKMSTILDISLHSFWDIILNRQLNESEINKFISFTKTDEKMICNTLFFEYQTTQRFNPILSMFMNVRSILLYGEQSENNKKTENIIFFMKLYGINIIHDINNHILPKYPREIRYTTVDTSVEDNIIDFYKFNEIVSLDFFSSITNVNISNNSLDSNNIFHKTGMSWLILDILSLLNFEDDLFNITTTSSKLELNAHTLTTSNITKKSEKTLVKVIPQKNIKNKLLSYIMKLQCIINRDEIPSISDSYKLKSEIELSKILLKKKEILLKMIFKDSFLPTIEKLPISKGFRYVSCVSKEKIAIDFWIKTVLEKYHKEQTKELQHLTEEELQICLNRLKKAMELVCPYLLREYYDTKDNRNNMMKLVFIYRNIIIVKLEELLIGKKIKIFSTDDEKRNSNDIVIQNDQIELIKNYFQKPNLEIDISELNDVLKRLYAIDCELFPDIGGQEVQKELKRILNNEVLDKIIFLRLAIASNMVFMTGSWDDVRDTVESDMDRWSVMKKIESALFKSELIDIDKDLLDTERNLMMKILKNCKKSKNINDEKLKKVFLEIKQISCRNSAETFDMADNIKYFDKITTKENKMEILCREVEKIINNSKRIGDSIDDDKVLAENYNKIESLLQDIELKFSPKDENCKKTWIYYLYDNVIDIRNLISNDIIEPSLKPDSMRGDIINYLQIIKQWVDDTRKLQRKSFNRLNNVTKKLNKTSNNNERKIKMSSTEIPTNTNDFNDEKRAFEKAFSELENRINDLDDKNTSKENYGKMIDTEIMNKNDDDLRNLILSMEKELADSKLGKAEIKEAKIWLSDRSREQLEDDCRNLAHKMLVKKLEGFLNEDSNDNYEQYPMKDNQILQFEDEINLKLARYQELCDSVERLKIPQIYSKEQITPSNTQYDTFSRKSYPDSKMKLDYSQSHKYNKSPFPDSEDDNIDLYFKKRLNELQNYMKSPKKEKVNSKETRIKNFNNSDVLVDGFEIEDEKTPRYYSMRLQDIQHERKEDEMGSILHQMEQERFDIIETNKNLQQQVFISQNLIENLQIKLESLETDKVLNQKLQSGIINDNSDYDSKYKYEDTRLLRNEMKRLSTALLAAQHQIDKQNTELINLASSINNYQHENNNLLIKNKYLERSFLKLEDIYKDLIHQLEYSRQSSMIDRNDWYQNPKDSFKDSDSERLLRQSERDKMELVKKLDILDQQNELLKEHCERLDIELSNANKKVAESQTSADYHLKQAIHVTEILDGMKSESERYHSISTNSMARSKDEEIKRLKNQILQLENKLIVNNQI